MLMKNPRSGGFVRSVQATVVGAVLIVAILATAAVVGFRLLGNPFSTVTKDRTPPPVLLELKDLAEFHAARAQFEVTVDIEKDVKWVPSFLAGERVQFVAVGTVDAVADFRTLDASAVTVDEDTSTVTVRLGAVQVQPPVLDHQLSHVMNRDRGLINRIGGMFDDNPTSEASPVPQGAGQDRRRGNEDGSRDTRRRERHPIADLTDPRARLRNGRSPLRDDCLRARKPRAPIAIGSGEGSLVATPRSSAARRLVVAAFWCARPGRADDPAGWLKHTQPATADWCEGRAHCPDRHHRWRRGRVWTRNVQSRGGVMGAGRLFGNAWG